MLNLTRFPSESIQIGDDITVVVLGVNGQQIRIGVEAPRNVTVLRQELIEQTPKECADDKTVAHQGGEVDANADPAVNRTSVKQPKVTYKRRRNLQRPIKS
jgi:carbon storage regulator